VFRLRQSSAPDVRRDRLGEVIAAAQMGDGLRVRQQLSEMLPLFRRVVPHGPTADRSGSDRGTGVSGTSAEPLPGSIGRTG
jgi:hypothetical protein